MSINRVVIVVSPIFVGIAGWLVAWIAQHFPGHPHLDASEVTAIFIAGAMFAAGKVALWIRGWQKGEAAKATVAAAQASAEAWNAQAAAQVKPVPVPARKATKPRPKAAVKA